MSYRDLLSSHLRLRAGIALLALGLGSTEAAFIFTARWGLQHGGYAVFIGLSTLVLLRFAFQDRVAALETHAMREVVSALRGRLLKTLRVRAVPAYRPDFKRDLVRALEETAPRVGEGFLAAERCLASALQGLILIPCLLFLSWRLALMSLLLIVPAWLAVRWRSRSLRALERAETLGRSEGRRALADFSDGLEASLGNGFEAALQTLNADLETAHTPEWRWRLAQGRYPALLEAGFFFALAGLVLIGGASLGSLGSWILFSGLLLLAYRPVREAARHYPVSVQGAQALGDAEKLLREWERFPRRRTPDAHRLNALALDQVNFGYRDGQSVFEKFSVEFPSDRVTGITGPNGAGKTTLLRLLANAETPAMGRILWPEAARRGGVSYLPQRVAPGSDWMGWAEFLRVENPVLWKELDALLGLNRFLEKAAHPEALSGGERQRMALARAVSSSAPFLLLDEPTTALPGDERARILEQALALWTRPFGAEQTRRGALIVSHEPFLGSVCDRLFALHAEDREAHALRPDSISR